MEKVSIDFEALDFSEMEKIMAGSEAAGGEKGKFGFFCKCKHGKNKGTGGFFCRCNSDRELSQKSE